MLKKVVWHSVATAFASSVFPVPGGPYSSIPYTENERTIFSRPFCNVRSPNGIVFRLSLSGCLSVVCMCVIHCIVLKRVVPETWASFRDDHWGRHLIHHHHHHYCINVCFSMLARVRRFLQTSPFLSDLSFADSALRPYNEIWNLSAGKGIFYTRSRNLLQ